MPETVFNTSPVQYLYQLGLIDCLHSLYGKIYIPEEVISEIERGKEEGIELPEIQQLSFVEKLNSKTMSFSQLVRDLGKGETAVILHGLETPGSIVVLDDLLARKIAIELGLKLTGTAGILIAAKSNGLIDKVYPYLDKMERLGFYLAPEHKSLILQKANEDKTDS